MIETQTSPYAALILRVSLGILFLGHAGLKIFVLTPDWNGLELYAGRSEDQWPHMPAGELQMVTRRLDLQDFLAAREL